MTRQQSCSNIKSVTPPTHKVHYTYNKTVARSPTDGKQCIFKSKQSQYIKLSFKWICVSNSLTNPFSLLKLHSCIL